MKAKIRTGIASTARKAMNAITTGPSSKDRVPTKSHPEIPSERLFIVAAYLRSKTQCNPVEESA
jgi:hypothetical protein